MLVNKHFSDKLEATTGKEKAFSDTKNAGDIAFKVGFKEKDKNTGKLVAKDKWQSYTLAFMMQYPDKGMDGNLYKAMVVAKDLELIKGDESRWDEPLSKEEAIQLIINTHLAKNKVYGYESEVEYGNLNVARFKIASSDSKVLGVDPETGLEYGENWTELEDSKVPADPNKELIGGTTLGDVKAMLDAHRQFLVGEGLSEAEVNKQLDEMAKSFGTSLSEIRRIVVSDTPVQTETPPPSNSGVGNSNSGGDYVPPQQPTQPSGLEDNIFNREGNRAIPDSTESDPDFNLEAW